MIDILLRFKQHHSICVSGYTERGTVGILWACLQSVDTEKKREQQQRSQQIEAGEKKLRSNDTHEKQK